MFTLDSNKTPHMWTARQDIPSIARNARLAAAHVVAQLAVLHKPDGSAAVKRAYDAVEEAVMKLARSELQDSSSNSTSGWCYQPYKPFTTQTHFNTNTFHCAKHNFMVHIVHKQM